MRPAGYIGFRERCSSFASGAALGRLTSNLVTAVRQDATVRVVAELGLLFAIGAWAIVLTPWAVRNAVQFGQPTPGSIRGDEFLYLSNHIPEGGDWVLDGDALTAVLDWKRDDAGWRSRAKVRSQRGDAASVRLRYTPPTAEPDTPPDPSHASATTGPTDPPICSLRCGSMDRATSSCVFCRIIAGELPGTFVAESERAVAFMDINPASDGHLLVIPKRHSQDLFDIPADDLSAVTRTAPPCRIVTSSASTLRAPACWIVTDWALTSPARPPSVVVSSWSLRSAMESSWDAAQREGAGPALRRSWTRTAFPALRSMVFGGTTVTAAVTPRVSWRRRATARASASTAPPRRAAAAWG